MIRLNNSYMETKNYLVAIIVTEKEITEEEIKKVLENINKT